MERDVLFLYQGLAAGFLGGCLAYLHVLYDGFAALPKKPLSDSYRAKRERLIFCALRAVYGAALGFVVTFWFIDDARIGVISPAKLFFVQFAAGACSSFLQAIGTRARALLD